jgi:quinone-modifying oxidoreductase subunit QmoA
VEATIDNPFNYGMDQIKAAYLPHDMAFPFQYVIDPSIVGTGDGAKAAEACPYGAVDLDDKGQEMTIKAAAVVWATGWTPYDPTKLATYNYNDSPDLITNVMMERLAAPAGPTGGKILRPSNGEAPKSVAFVQCAGSRDENHLPFCSTICCLASLKQSMYLREQLPDTEVTIYFIDIRAMDRNEDVYTKVKDNGGVNFVKSKIARITPQADGSLEVEGENTTTLEKFTANHDMVVLATGMQPNTAENKVPGDASYDDYGFLLPQEGIIAAGTTRRPCEVVSCGQDGTAAALKAIQKV